MTVDGHTTRVSQHVKAPPERVYRALLDAQAVAQWKAPDGMIARVHRFDPREGGLLRVSLTYDSPDSAGKTSAHTDTYHGRFIRLVPAKQVIEVDEFETADPALRGEMTITITLIAANGETEIVAVHEGLPRAVSAIDNELGWRMALGKLAALVEAAET